MNKLQKCGVTAFCLASVFILFSVQSALADPVTITIENILPNFINGFGYSVIHSADGGGPPFYTSGSFLYNPLNGTLAGDLDTTSGFSLTSIMGSLTATQGTINITGGNISDSGAGGYASGTLDYSINGGSAHGDSGQFYFAAQAFGSGGPNNLSDLQFHLWGQNWIYIDSQTIPPTHRLGIDLVGTIKPIPEPSTLLLLGTGLTSLFVARRFRRRSQ